MRSTMNRRAFLISTVFVAASFPLSACKKEERCANCGMVIDRASPWRVEIVSGTNVTSFDTPRCALVAWRGGKSSGTLRVQEYYDRTWRDASEVRFVVGGDVLGPMGPDFVPVDPSRVSKFIQDHAAERAYRVDEITTDVLSK